MNIQQIINNAIGWKPPVKRGYVPKRLRGSLSGYARELGRGYHPDSIEAQKHHATLGGIISALKPEPPQALGVGPKSITDSRLVRLISGWRH